MRITKAKCNTVASYHNWDVLNIFFAWINFKPQCITGKQVEQHFIIIIIEIQCIRECVCERHNRKFLKYQNKKWDDFTFIFCNGMCTACAIIISWSEMWKRKIFNMCILLRERCLAIFFSLCCFVRWLIILMRSHWSFLRFITGKIWSNCCI